METTPENTPAPLDSLFAELRDLPRHPPRREMLPGLHWRAFFRGPMLLILPFLLIFTAFPIAIFASISSAKTSHGRASARVIQVESIEPNQTFVKYRYTVNGRSYTGAGVDTDGSSFSNLRVGSALPIRFEGNRPQSSAPITSRGNSDDFPLPVLFLFPLMALIFFAPVFFPQICSLLMARKLLSKGVLASGNLRFVRSLPMQSPMLPGGSSQLIYEFNDQNGLLRRGAARCAVKTHGWCSNFTSIRRLWWHSIPANRRKTWFSKPSSLKLKGCLCPLCVLLLTRFLLLCRSKPRGRRRGARCRN